MREARATSSRRSFALGWIVVALLTGLSAASEESEVSDEVSHSRRSLAASFWPEGYVPRKQGQLLDGPSIPWPPSPAALKAMWLCVSGAPGLWRESFPLWHDPLGSDPPGSPRLEWIDSCVRPIESIHDIRTLFAGSNITLIGDSILREVAQDVFVSGDDCYAPTSNHLLPNGEAGWWARGGPTWHNVSTQCKLWLGERIAFHEPFDFSMTGDAGRLPLTMTFRFHAFGPGFPDEVTQTGWMQSLFNSTDAVSGPVVMGFGHWNLDAEKHDNAPASVRIEHLMSDITKIMGLMAVSPRLDLLKKWVYWWIPHIPEDTIALMSLNRTAVSDIYHAAASRFREAGFKVIDASKFTLAEGSNGYNVRPYLTTRDGRHFRTFYQNVALARDTLSGIYLDHCVPSYKHGASVKEAKGNLRALEDLITLWTFRSRAGRGLPPLRFPSPSPLPSPSSSGPKPPPRADPREALYRELVFADLVQVPLIKCKEVWADIKRWEAEGHPPPPPPPDPSPCVCKCPVCPSPSSSPSTSASASVSPLVRRRSPSRTPAPASHPSRWRGADNDGNDDDAEGKEGTTTEVEHYYDEEPSPHPPPSSSGGSLHPLLIILITFFTVVGVFTTVTFLRSRVTLPPWCPRIRIDFPSSPSRFPRRPPTTAAAVTATISGGGDDEEEEDEDGGERISLNPHRSSSSSSRQY